MPQQLKDRIIETKRLRLRPVVLDDAEDMFEVRSHKSNYQWTRAGQWTSLEQARDWAMQGRDSPSAFRFAIELLPSPGQSDQPSLGPKPTFIGALGYAGDDEIGYELHPDHRGKGYATEALSAFLNVYFEPGSEKTFLTAIADAENLASRKLLEKCGFREEKKMVLDNKTLGSRDSVLYRIEKDARC